MTLSQLATLNKASGGFFFRRDTLQRFGENMKSFSIKANKAVPSTVTVTRKADGREWIFDKATGRVVHAIEFQQKLDGTRATVTEGKLVTA